MAIAKRPDPRHRKARIVIESLGDDESDSLIKYWIEMKDKRIEQLEEKNKEYQSVFNMIRKFTKTRGPIKA